jgi:hypothetical protein
MRERGKGMNEKKKLDLGQKNYRNWDNYHGN